MVCANGRRRSAEPCLLGLYSGVPLLYEGLPAAAQAEGKVAWEGKQAATFSDAITVALRWLWTLWVLPRAGHAEVFAKLPQALQQLLLNALALRPERHS